MRLPLLLLAFLFSGATWAQLTLQHEGAALEFEQPPQRIVALNWAAAEALLGLGITPVAIAEREGYRLWANHPPLPEGVADVGTRREPNLEAISAVKPDLILVSSDLNTVLPALESIAPTAVHTLFKPDQMPDTRAREALLELAAGLGREDTATALLEEVSARQQANAEALAAAGKTGTPVLLMTFINDQTLRVQGSNALLSTALEDLSLENAWRGASNHWGFATISLAQLGAYPDAHFLILSPTPPGLQEALQKNPVWQAMQPVKAGRVTKLPPVWSFGSVLTAARMGDVLVEAWSATTP